jgi:hypothetical protein
MPLTTTSGEIRQMKTGTGLNFGQLKKRHLMKMREQRDRA